MHKFMLFALVSLTGCASSEVSQAESGLVAQCVNSYIEAFDSGTRLANSVACDWGSLTDQSVADAIRTGVVEYLERQGVSVGYKVTFADDGQVIGVLIDSMLLANGATIDLESGSRILVEADLLVRVGSASINQARSLEDVASSIDQVYPFMESSDMMLPTGTPRTKSTWTATNGNLRWGVLGDPIRVEGDDALETVARLGMLEVSLFGPEGNELQRESMARHPLQSVLDVLEEIARTKADPLQPGDLISVGNFGRPRFPTPGESYTTQYHGLSETQVRVSVSFK